MKKNSLWYIPGIFFCIASLLNLLGRLLGNVALAQTVKPALLPLLALTTLAYLVEHALWQYDADSDSFEAPLGGIVSRSDRREIALLLGAQLLGCAGDTFLIGSGFALFASGMAAFLCGHVCYMCLYGKFSWEGLTWKQWVLSLLGMAVIVAVLVLLIGIKGALLGPMIVYGFALTLLVFSGLAGVVRIGGATWWIILCGALLFLFSDSLIAMESFDVAAFAHRDFVIMLTYLAAQSLLAVGGIRLILDK